LFEILKTKDAERYIKLFPDYETMKKFMRQTFALPARRADMDSMLVSFTNEQYNDQILVRGAEKFNDFLLIGERKEVAWNDIKLNRYSIDTSLENNEFSDPEASIKSMKGSLDFFSGQKEYTVKFGQVIWFAAADRWYGIELANFFEKGKETEDDYEISAPEPDSVAFLTADTISVMPAEAAAAAYKPAKPKKTPVKKAPAKKPAAKSAALKPKQ
jgi:hypothetical protein